MWELNVAIVRENDKYHLFLSTTSLYMQWPVLADWLEGVFTGTA